MRNAFSPIFALILASAALCAADLGHGVITMLGASGLVTGTYGSYYHEAVVPALLGALICATIVAAATFGKALARAAGFRGDWLTSFVERIARINLLLLIPLVFSLQLALLFGMESAEQIAAFGRPLGIGAAMGAPLPLALSVHAFAAILLCATTILFARALGRAARALTHAATPFIRRLLIKHSAAPSPQRRRLIFRTENARPTPLARRIANRPPPLAASVA